MSAWMYENRAHSWPSSYLGGTVWWCCTAAAAHQGQRLGRTLLLEGHWLEGPTEILLQWVVPASLGCHQLYSLHFVGRYTWSCAAHSGFAAMISPPVGKIQHALILKTIFANHLIFHIKDAGTMSGAMLMLNLACHKQKDATALENTGFSISTLAALKSLWWLSLVS